MSSIDDVARRILKLERTVRQLSAPQLSKSSIMDGAIEQVRTVDTGEVDEFGNPVFRQDVVARYGEQPDGTNAMVVLNGPIPVEPTPPAVVGGPEFISVEWDGLFADGSEAPSDFLHVAVHVAEAQAVDDGDILMPSPETVRNTIHTLDGGSVVVADVAPGTYYVSLVTVTQAGMWSQPAEYSTGEPGVSTGIDVTAREAAAAAQQTADQAVSDAGASRSIAIAAQRAAELSGADAIAARDAAARAQQDATTALTSADGKSKIWYSTAQPQSGEGADGDTWYQRTTSAFGTIVGVWEKRAGLWESRAIGNQAIDTVSAGKITSGTLGVGQVITVGQPTDGSYLTIGNSMITTYRVDAEGEEAPSLQLGRVYDPENPDTLDQIQLIDPVSQQGLVGMDASGVMWSQEMSTNHLAVGGYSLGDLDNWDDTLFQLGRGRVATYAFPNTTYPQANTELGIGEINWTMKPGRMYRISFDGNIHPNAINSSWRLFLRAESGTDADTPAPTPTINSRQIAMGFFSNSAVNVPTRCYIAAYLGLGVPEREGRVLLSLQRLGGGYPQMYWDGGSYLHVDDIGYYPGAFGEGSWSDDGQLNTGGGTPYVPSGGTSTTTTPTVTKKTYTKTYKASWSRSWRGGSLQSGSEVRQGYSSGQMVGAVGFPAAVQSDLAGATVSKIELYMYAHHWYYNKDGTLRVGTHAWSALPGSVPAAQTAYPADFKWKSKTGGKWMTLPASWNKFWANGAHRGILIGQSTTSSNIYYGRFDGYGYANPPQLRITYTK